MPEEVKEQVQEQQVQQPTLAEMVWEGKQPIKVEEKKEEAAAEIKEEKAPDVNELLKANLGYESWETAKTELEELKAFKNKPVEEVKFANEESKNLHDAIIAGDKKKVLNILKRQETLDEIMTAHVTKETAPSIVKMSMQEKYKGLSQTQIEYKYNKEFGIPSKPVMSDTDTAEEYADKVSEWEAKVKNIEEELLIEAAIVKPDLEKLRSELILPDSSKSAKPETNVQPTQEDLDAAQKQREAFLQDIDKSLGEFSGFSVSVKDKDVDFAVSYSPSQDEKKEVVDSFKKFAEKNFDANALFAPRWVNKDNTLNVAQMVKDYLRIHASEKANEKLVNDAANQRLEIFLKEKKQVNLNGSAQSGDFMPDNKTEHQKMQEHFWGN